MNYCDNFIFFFVSMSRYTPTMICCSGHTICLSEEGNLCSFGYSISNAHGHEEEEILLPTIIPTLRNIISVAGKDHCVCLDSDGNVFTFGNNEYGELGIGIDKEILLHTHIPQNVDIPPCTQITCGSNVTICLTKDRELYSFGYNYSGQLGIGSPELKHTYPQKIESLANVEFIECGGDYSFCKTFDNQIYCWGKNDSKQLGIDDRTYYRAPIQCLSLSNEDIVDIKCGYGHTLVLTSNQDVLSCGTNQYGQIGRNIGNRISSSKFEKIEDLSEIGIIRIECGYDYSMCIDINNDIHVFGNNDIGQIGLGNTSCFQKPIKHPSLSNIIDISKGEYHNFVKTSNNEIYAFGWNRNAQLGIETDDEYQNFPIRVFDGNEDIWFSNINKSKAKSARK